MITGIEQNPGPTPNTEALPFTVVVAGTFHQGQSEPVLGSISWETMCSQ